MSTIFINDFSGQKLIRASHVLCFKINREEEYGVRVLQTWSVSAEMKNKVEHLLIVNLPSKTAAIDAMEELVKSLGGRIR